VQFASSELARAEVRVRSARDAMFKFRVEHNEVDPAATAQATLGLAAQLEAERSKLSSDLASVSGYLSGDAPSVQMLKSRIAALASEISRIQGQVSLGPSSELRGAGDKPAAAGEGPDPNSNAIASVLATYQELVLDQEFAERAYTAAMASLERARSEVNRNQSYLAIYGQPSLAQDAAYPRRWLNILIILVLSSIFWAIGGLGVLTVRDHIQ
jgi:capsular polysaccharide transport system permease protein